MTEVIENAPETRHSSHQTIHHSFQFEIMTGKTGIRVSGLQVRDATDEQIEELRRLISEHCVAVFPDQNLEPAQHAEFVSRFGPLMFTPGEDRLEECPDVLLLINEGKAKHKTGGFHTDTCFVPQPPSFTTLHAIELPEHGGDTVFTNQYEAYEALSPVMKSWLTGLKFKHVVFAVKRPEEVPDPVWHPAVRTHPVTGRKCLYITTPYRCVAAEGMTAAEGANLIKFLYEHSQSIHFMYRHRWRPGDLVMWDNRCTMHAAVHDHGDQPRTLHRIMCEGERPYE